MSTPFPKSKEKRPRSSSEPSKSFVKNVTSRVSGLLPATIAKWFSSPSSSNTNGSAQAADATDSSTEDEASESPITTQPPAKKIRYASPGEYRQHVPVETKCTSTNTDPIDETSTVFSPIGRNSTRRDIFASTRVQSTNDPVPTTEEETAKDTYYKPQHSISAIEQPTTKRRKSLFGTPLNDSYRKPTEPSSGNVRDPCFKPSLLTSPFYVGRTMYGGAASSYLSPTFKKKKINVTNETTNNDSVTMSHSARRVMDLLEHYSSPLVDAKRIPQITRDNDDLSTNPLIQSVNPYGPKSYSYKTQELYVPSVASILTIKRKNRLMNSTNAARQIIASHSSSSEYLPYPKSTIASDVFDEDSGDKFTTKVKSRLTRTNRERNIEMENIDSETVNLPNVVLQIDKDNLPKFTYGPTLTSQPSHGSSIQTPVIITPEALKKAVEYEKSEILKMKNAENTESVDLTNEFDPYQFSTPVPITRESNKTPPTPPNYSFGIPESGVDNDQENKTKDDQTSIISHCIVENKLPVQKSTDWKCSSCWVMNKTDINSCVCCGDKKPGVTDGPIKKCSVCNIAIKHSQSDKCTECEKKSNNIDKPFASIYKEANTTKWKCNDCWIDNNESAGKCVCCGGKHPSKTTSAIVVNTDSTVDNDWKCNDCWIKNKSTLTKCAACGGSKPGSQTSGFKFGHDTAPKSFGQTTTNTTNTQRDNNVKETTDNTFKNIAKSQTEKWECSLCLVRNDTERDTCICCEASKPNAKKDSQIKFNFHQPSEITFKFGIQPKNQDISTDIETEECNMGEESETNNNILPKTSLGFGLTVKKFDQLSESVDKPAEAPKINFTFGVPKETQVSPVRNSIFGIPSKPIETSKNIDENLQEVPQVFTPPQSDGLQKKIQGLFSTPATPHVAPVMPGLVPLHLINQNSTIRKDLSFMSSNVVPTTTSEVQTQQSNFTFPNIMPATNLFTTKPPITTTISNVLSPPSTTPSIFQNTNMGTTHTTSSFFQKSDSGPTLGVSFFSKTDSTATTTTTTTTSSGSMGTMQPVFSFGGQGSVVPQAEKPKFNFSFSNNKPDTATSMFKPTFGVSTDSNISTNKFNLPSNSIIGGNGTQLNTANALPTGNTLTTPAAPTIFGAVAPKENMWPPSTNNMFATNSTTNGDQKPPAFTFGSVTPFNANNTPFGNVTQQTQPNNTPFGSNAQQTQPNNAFGGTAQQTQPNSTPFGNTAQQAQPNSTPFGNTAQQAQPNSTPFGNTAQQAQPNNVPFGSSAQQTQSNNVPFGSPAPQVQTNTPFGSNPQQAQPNNVPFGTNPQQPQTNNSAFGATQQTQQAQPPHVFGIPNQTTASQPTLFGNPLQNQAPPNLFGGLQVPNNPMSMPNMPLFGAPNPVGVSSFGGMNPPIPTFETSTIAPAQPAPASFNFGGQPSTGIFGFGQPQQQPGQMPQQPEGQPGIYGFGGPAGTAPQMQFNIGSAPNTTGRRVRKAMRRTQR